MHSPFQITVVHADQARAQVRATGPLDRSTVDLLTAVLETLPGWGRRHVRLDMSRVTVSDQGCLPALAPGPRDVPGRARTPGAHLRSAPTSPPCWKPTRRQGSPRFVGESSCPGLGVAGSLSKTAADSGRGGGSGHRVAGCGSDRCLPRCPPDPRPVGSSTSTPIFFLDGGPQLKSQRLKRRLLAPTEVQSEPAVVGGHHYPAVAEHARAGERDPGDRSPRDHHIRRTHVRLRARATAITGHRPGLSPGQRAPCRLGPRVDTKRLLIALDVDHAPGCFHASECDRPAIPVPERCCADSANPFTVVAVGVDPDDGDRVEVVEIRCENRVGRRRTAGERRLPTRRSTVPKRRGETRGSGKGSAQRRRALLHASRVDCRSPHQRSSPRTRRAGRQTTSDPVHARTAPPPAQTS